jgi:hypothetical protein
MSSVSAYTEADADNYVRCLSGPAPCPILGTAMPKPLATDWEAIKAMYVRGLGPQEIADTMGISYDAIRKRIARGKWKQTASAVSEAVSRVVSHDLLGDSKQHVKEVLEAKNRLLRTLIEKNLSSLSLAELEVWAKTLDKGDTIGRRGHGIDIEQEAKRNTTLVQVVINTQDASAFHEIEPVTSTPQSTIDVEPSSSDAQSTGAEQGQA